MLICPNTPPEDCLAVAPRQQAFSLREFIPNLCPAGLALAWPSPHFSHLPPSPLILGWAVRTARSLKGVELSALPTSGHLCDERPVSRPVSYKVGIPPSPITGRAEGSRFVLGSILLYRVTSNEPQYTYRGCACFPTGLADSTHPLYQPPTHLLVRSRLCALALHHLSLCRSGFRATMRPR